MARDTACMHCCRAWPRAIACALLTCGMILRNCHQKMRKRRGQLWSACRVATLGNAEVVAAHCVPWLVHPTSQLPQVPGVKKQVCTLSAAYIAGTCAICAYTQLNGQTVACQALLDAINQPVTTRVSSKVVALSQLGPVATSGVAARRRKRMRDAQRPGRSITSHFDCPLGHTVLIFAFA